MFNGRSRDGSTILWLCLADAPEFGFSHWVLVPMTKVLIGLIRLYQITLSRLVGRCCRFYPTCSAYAIEALQDHGFFKGFWLMTVRICKCHPFHPGGYDPVPPVKTSGGQDKDLLDE